jgi:hypothetical protein
MNIESKNLPSEPGAQWPTCAIFTSGTFGSRSEAGRRYYRRSAMALGTMIAVCLLYFLLSGSLFPKGSLKSVISMAPGAAFAYIAWEFRRYLLSLDELARRIQLESIAWTYLSGIAIAMLVGGLGMVYGWQVNPIWLIMLEPVRSVWLYFVTRRYQ